MGRHVVLSSLGQRWQQHFYAEILEDGAVLKHGLCFGYDYDIGNVT